MASEKEKPDRVRNAYNRKATHAVMEQKLRLNDAAKKLGLKSANLVAQPDSHRIEIGFDRTIGDLESGPTEPRIDKNLTVTFKFDGKGNYRSYGVDTRGGFLSHQGGTNAMRAVLHALGHSLERKTIGNEFQAHHESLSRAINER